MAGYDELYQQVLRASFEGTLDKEVQKIEQADYDKKQLDSLLHPDRYPVVIGFEEDCKCALNEPCQCDLHCLFSAVKRDENGKIQVSSDCTGCAECLRSCTHGVFRERKDVVPLFEALHERNVPVYAMIAPAFLGQFGEGITSGKLRSAFKKIGFFGMIEVALFADLLTLKEALEFDVHVKTKEDFLLTSCCCPLWVAMIRKQYTSLLSHVPPSVSPMVACGRSIKRIHPDAKTVFIGPCIAKKAEAKEKDVADAVDFVLTFSEMQDIFQIANVDPLTVAEDVRDHSSRAGRIYARTGGVSEAVERTLDKLKAHHVPFKAKQADGVPECRSLLEAFANGNITANFLEGMGCKGGCVGGPRVVLKPEQGKENVNEYGNQANFETPVDNPYTFALLKRLGYETVEDLLKEDNMFIRKFE